MIDAITSGRDVLGSWPTGAGKFALLPDPGVDGRGERGNYACDLTVNFLNEGPGQRAEPGGSPCGLFNSS